MQMSTSELTKLINAVDQINGQLLEQYPDGEYVLQIKYMSGYMVYIEWLGNIVWHTDDDTREWIEDAKKDAIGKPIGDYESWEPYLKREMQKVIEQISEIKL